MIMEGSLASIFMEGSLPSSPISWTTPEENIEELQHRLVCVSMELQTTREGAKTHRQLNEAKLHHLHELLEATKKERDEAFQECKKLQECLLHWSNHHQATTAAGSPCTTSSSGQVNHQHPSSFDGLEPSCFLHKFKPKPMQSFSQDHDVQAIFSLDELEQFGMDFLSEDKALEEDQSFGDSQEQFSMDILNEDMSFYEDESLDLTDLQVEQPLHSNWEAYLPMKSSWEANLSSPVSSAASQSGTDGEKAVAMPVHTPAMPSSTEYLAQSRTLSSSQPSAMAKKALSSPAMSVSASQSTATVKNDMPSSAMPSLQIPAMSASQSAVMAKKSMPSTTMSSPSILANSASHSSAMAMPSWAVPLPQIPAMSASQYSGMAKEGMHSSAISLPHIQTMSASPSLAMAKKAMPSLAMSSLHLPAMPSSQASTTAKRAYHLPTSVLPQKRVHLPEPPEANIDVMLSSLPEKGKLLEAVMRAGPLLQQLLLAGPLPQWQYPPPKLNTMDIPKVPMSPNSVLLPLPHVQYLSPYMPPHVQYLSPYMPPHHNMPSPQFNNTMNGFSPCLLPTLATAKSSMHMNHTPSSSCSRARKLPKLASRGVR